MSRVPASARASARLMPRCRLALDHAEAGVFVPLNRDRFRFDPDAMPTNPPVGASGVSLWEVDFSDRHARVETKGGRRPVASDTSSQALLSAAFAGRGDATAEVPLQRADDRAARERLARLLRDEFRSVWRLVRRFGVPSASADDAAQEVFIIAARRLDEIEIGCERRYLFGIAIRVAANARRAHAKRPEHADTDALDESQSQSRFPMRCSIRSACASSRFGARRMTSSFARRSCVRARRFLRA